MNKITILLSTYLLLTASFKKIDCSCNYLGTAAHKRASVKNRHFSDTHGTRITVSDILKMKITDLEKESIHQDENIVLNNEKRMVAVTGYAWILKISDEDCDIHIELSETNDKNAKRIIAEIPNTSEYCQLHTRVLNDLVNKFKLNKKQDYRFDISDNGGKPLKLTVTGLLFWDSGHPTNHNHGSEKVGSIWELHPVSKLEWK